MPDDKDTGVTTADADGAPSTKQNTSPAANADLTAAETATATKPDAPAKPVTLEEYLGSVPAEVAEQISEGIALREQRRANLKKSLVACANNPFNEEELDKMDTAQLEKLAQLAGLDQRQQSGGFFARTMPTPTDDGSSMRSNVADEPPALWPVAA